MPANKIWTGTLSFVLVSIPVDLVPAVRHSKVAFHMMHQKDNSPISLRMYCPADDKFIHPEHIVHGYEIEKDKYVIVRENEYKALEPERSQNITIDSFVNFEEIDPIQFDRPYYLLPRKGAGKSYQLLTEVMKETKKVGIGKFVLMNKEHLVAVWAHENILVMLMLHFKDQIADKTELLPKIKAESDKAEAISEIIKKHKAKYEPEKYIDDYHRKILDFLKKKAKKYGTVTIEETEEIEEAAEEQEHDLISALEESLAKVKSK